MPNQPMKPRQPKKPNEINRKAEAQVHPHRICLNRTRERHLSKRRHFRWVTGRLRRSPGRSGRALVAITMDKSARIEVAIIAAVKAINCIIFATKGGPKEPKIATMNLRNQIIPGNLNLKIWHKWQNMSHVLGRLNAFLIYIQLFVLRYYPSTLY